MKKNILVIHHVYPIGQEIGDKIRTLNMIRSLDEIGLNVYFVAFFTKGLIRMNIEKKTYKAPTKKVFYIYSLPNRLRLNKLSSLLRSLIVWGICKLYKIDIIQAELAHGASCVKLVPEIPVITDFHSDIVPELAMKGFSAYNLSHAAKDNIYALKRSVQTITVSRKLFENLSFYYKQESRNAVLPCNIEIAPFMNLPDNTRNRMRQDYNLNDRIVLCYSGGLYVWQCINETIELIIRLHRINPHYFFCLYTIDDTSMMTDKLKSLEGNYLIKKLSRQEIPSYLSLIDVGFVLRKNSLVNINASPTKTAEYFAAGAMVIATQYSGDAPELIKASGHGVVLDHLDLTDEEIIDLDKKIVSHYTDHDQKSKIIKEYIYRYRSWAYNERQLLDIYRELRFL